MPACLLRLCPNGQVVVTLTEELTSGKASSFATPTDRYFFYRSLFSEGVASAMLKPFVKSSQFDDISNNEDMRHYLQSIYLVYAEQLRAIWGIWVYNSDGTPRLNTADMHRIYNVIAEAVAPELSHRPWYTLPHRTRVPLQQSLIFTADVERHILHLKIK
jgi:hypothetical protein